MDYEERIALLEAQVAVLQNAVFRLDAEMEAKEPAPAPAETVTISTVHYMTAIRNLREARRRAEYEGELELDDLIGSALSNLDPTFYNEPPF